MLGDNKDQKNKKAWYKRWWVWGVGGFILIILIAAASGGTPASTDTNVANNVEEAQATDTEATWQEVKSWTGTGIKKTEPFTITGKQWRVTWTNKGGYLGITTYKPGSNIPNDILANSTEATTDTSYVYKSGEFYLDVNSSGSWEIKVEELK